jgi:hypothetical protein
VPGAGRLVGGTAATASQRRVGHLSRTFGACAFVQRRLGVWAKAVTGGDQAGIVARSRKPAAAGAGRKNRSIPPNLKRTLLTRSE